MLPKCCQWTQAQVTRETPLPLVSAVKGQVMILPRQCRKKLSSNQASLCCLWLPFVLGSSSHDIHKHTAHIYTYATQAHVTHAETHPTPATHTIWQISIWPEVIHGLLVLHGFYRFSRFRFDPVAHAGSPS